MATSTQKELADKPGFWVFIGGLSMFGIALAAFLAFYLFGSSSRPLSPSTDAAATQVAEKPTASATRKPQFEGMDVAQVLGRALPAKAAAITAERLDLTLAQTTQTVVRVIALDGHFKRLALGSGFFVSPDGLLVTNLHVVRDAKHALVKFQNGVEFTVLKITGLDESNDLVLLRVDTNSKVFLSITPVGPPPVGTRVFAIGNPEGLTNTVSEGVVSAVHRGIQGGRI